MNMIRQMVVRAISQIQWFWILVITGLCVRLITNAILGLGIDESYEAVHATQFQLSYFDHPPLSWWLIGIPVHLGFWHPFWIRLIFAVITTISTILIGKMTAAVSSQRSGNWAVAIYTVTPLFGIVNGWALPDSPLILGLLMTAYGLTMIYQTELPAIRQWVLAGIGGMIAVLAKYHAVLILVPMAIVWIITPKFRHKLRGIGPLIAIGTTAMGTLPIIIWNWQNDWASFGFQLSRGAPHTAGIGLIGHAINGVIGFVSPAAYLWPWMWLSLIGAGIVGLRSSSPLIRSWAICGFVPISVFTIVALIGSPGLPHWPGCGYLFLIPLLAIQVTNWQMSIRWLVRASAVGTIVILCLVMADLRWSILPESPLREMAPWSEIRLLSMRSHWPTHYAAIVTTDWMTAGKIGVALQNTIPVTVIGPDPRQFNWTAPVTSFSGKPVLIVLRERDSLPPGGSDWQDKATLSVGGNRFRILSGDMN